MLLLLTLPDLRLVGVYRPRRGRPGFGIPVFSRGDSASLYAQLRDGNDRVVDVRPCEVEASSVRWIGERVGVYYRDHDGYQFLTAPTIGWERKLDLRLLIAPGKPALHGFETEDGRILVGNRETLGAMMRQDLAALRRSPFVLHDVGEFLTDAALIAEAKALCAPLLDSPAPRTEQVSVPFAKGMLVYHVNSPSRKGTLTGRTRLMGRIKAWEVVFGSNDRDYVPEQVLRREEFETTSLEDKIAADQFGRPEDLRRRITFEKLKGSLSEFIYSMDAAEIDFLEYQFKPVLKFVESPNERLLLADEVGLGKTIEAALIWLELQARRDARRLLVVCPKMLVRNWRSELRSKFSVPIEQCSVEQLTAHMRDMQRVGSSHRFALIATYSSLRPGRDDWGDMENDDARLTAKGELVRAWSSWDAEYPFADLVIFDEAHVLRNPGSLVARTAMALSNAAEGVLCVSATPVNNKSEDLRSLLRLLDPGMFENEYLFQSLLAENTPAVQLSNSLAVTPPRLDEARKLLPELKRSALIGRSELLPRLEAIVGSADPRDISSILEAQRLIEQLNVLGRYVARTRRRHVAELRAQRSPMIVPVDFNEMERQFYWAITRLVRRRVERAGNRFSAFHLVGPQLRMASCIPAMVDAYRTGQLGEFEDALFVGFDADEDESDSDGDRDSAAEFAQFLHEYRAYDFEANDSKYAALSEVITQKLAEEKIVLFSFYRGTLTYLRRRLSADGIETAMIHGGITKQEDRDAEIERFASPDGPRVLLSSEVGSEGINLQFARVIVNYDLPWNPMRIEQRIGRIDRVGQQAMRLVIVHFKVRDTIEERLYEKLHQKLEVFRNSLGDLEAVIGGEVGKLTQDLFRRDLTREEEDQRIQETELVLRRQLEEQGRLEESSGSLLGFADYIRDRISRNRQLGRYVTPEELRSYIDDFFRRHFVGCRLDWDYPRETVFRLELTHEAHERMTDFLTETKQDAVPEQRARTIVGTLHVETAKRGLKHEGRRIVLVNHLSPLVRWITHENQHDHGAFFDTAALRLRDSSMPPGIYAFRVERWSFRGLRRREVLSYAVAHIESTEPSPPEIAEEVVLRLLQSGDDWIHRDCDLEKATRTLEVIRDDLADRHNGAFETFAAENQNLHLIQRRQVEAHFERRTKQDEQRLATATANRRSEQALRLARARLQNTSDKRREKLDELDRKAGVDQRLSEIAAGIFMNEP